MKQYTGHWWLPSAPDDRLVGTLALRAGDPPRLELVATSGVSESSKMGSLLQPQALGKDGSVLIHGQARCGKLFTLYDGFVHSSNFGMGAASGASFLFNRGFQGACIDDPTELQVDSVYMRYPGIDAWLDVRPFSIEYKEGHRHVTISQAIPEQETFEIDDKRQLVIAWTRRGPSHAIMQTRIDMTVLPWLGVKYKEPVLQSAASNDAFIIGQLLSMLLGSPTTTRRIKMYSPEHFQEFDGKTYQDELQALGAHFKLPESFRKWLPHDVLIPYDLVKDQFASLLQKWFHLHHECWGALVPYISGLRSPAPLAERRFFDLAASAESVHTHFRPNEVRFSDDECGSIWKTIRDSIPESRRSAYADSLRRVNALTYKQRIEELLRRFPSIMRDVIGDESAQDEFSKQVRDLRNVEAHRLKRSSETTVEGSKLVRIAAKLRVILDTWILAEVGIDPSVIEESMRNTRRYWYYANSDTWPWNY